MSMEARRSPLSSRAKPRDLRFAPSATDVNGSTALPFVIPSEAGGPAVRSISNRRRRMHPHGHGTGYPVGIKLDRSDVGNGELLHRRAALEADLAFGSTYALTLH